MSTFASSRQFAVERAISTANAFVALGLVAVPVWLFFAWRQADIDQSKLHALFLWSLLLLPVAILFALTDS